MPGHEANLLDARLTALREAYGAALPAKLARLQELARHLASAFGTGDAVGLQVTRPLLEEIRAGTHTLAGSAPTFGYQHVGEAARLAEQLAMQMLLADTLPTPSRLAELQGTLAVMAGSLRASQPQDQMDQTQASQVQAGPDMTIDRAAAERQAPADPPTPREATAAEEPFRPYRVLCLGADLPALKGAALTVRELADPETLLAQIDSFRPELLVLGTADALALAQLVWRQDRHAGIGIFIASTDPTLGQVLLAHGVTDAYCLARPLDPVTMRAQITRYLYESRAGLRQPNSFDLGPHLARLLAQGVAGGVADGPLPSPAADAAEAVAPAAARPRPKILVVDDDRYLVAIIANALAAHGMECLRAYGGDQGYAIAWREQPNAIITDVEMPNGTGDHMMLQLRRNPRTRDIPVIVMTQRRWEDGKDHALERDLRGRLGATCYLQKPVEMERLVQELARL